MNQGSVHYTDLFRPAAESFHPVHSRRNPPQPITPPGIRYVIVLGLLAALVSVLQSQPNDTPGVGSKIVYLEYQAAELAKTKAFFEQTFGWNFAEQTATYFTFFDGRLAGAFTKSDKCGRRVAGAPLIAIATDNLESARRRVMANGGRIVEDITDRPEGRRFIFAEPSGNEFAVVCVK